MKRKVYISPEIVQNDIYTVSNLALDVVIKNSTVEEPLTKRETSPIQTRNMKILIGVISGNSD